MRITPAHGVLIAVLALGAVTACDRNGNVGAGADNRICTPFPTTPANGAAATSPTIAVAGTEAASFDDCLHRWSYKLASSSDSADQVGRAVVQACGENLSRWNAEVVNASDRAPETFDLTTGRPTTPVERNYQYAQGKALFYVVQARAGHCAVPS